MSYVLAAVWGCFLSFGGVLLVGFEGLEGLEIVGDNYMFNCGIVVYLSVI
jgi:hypothetical protein